MVEPVVRDHAIGDHEDNHILALANPTVNADVIVSSDHHLLDIGPAWNGRLILPPRKFAQHVVGATRAQSPTPPAPVKTAAERFPELRGVQLDRFGLADEPQAFADDPQLG